MTKLDESTFIRRLQFAFGSNSTNFKIKFQKQIDKKKINAKTQVGQGRTDRKRQNIPPPPTKFCFLSPELSVYPRKAINQTNLNLVKHSLKDVLFHNTIQS